MPGEHTQCLKMNIENRHPQKAPLIVCSCETCLAEFLLQCGRTGLCGVPPGGAEAPSEMKPGLQRRRTGLLPVSLLSSELQVTGEPSLHTQTCLVPRTELSALHPGGTETTADTRGLALAGQPLKRRGGTEGVLAQVEAQPGSSGLPAAALHAPKLQAQSLQLHRLTTTKCPQASEAGPDPVPATPGLTYVHPWALHKCPQCPPKCGLKSSLRSSGQANRRVHGAVRGSGAGTGVGGGHRGRCPS